MKMKVPHYKPLALAISLGCSAYPITLFAEEPLSQEEKTKTADSQQEGTVPEVLIVQSATSAKSALSIAETPQTINSIGREEIEARGITSINQALRYVPGVVSEPRGGAITRFDQYTIRGFYNDLNYLDGLQLPYNGWNAQAQIDMLAVESIDILKGPVSVLYGNAIPGGTVALNGKKPQMTPSTTFGLGTGNHNLKEATFDSTGQIGDTNLSYRLLGLGRSRDGQADTTENERYMIAPSLTWQASDATTITLNGYYQNDPASGAYSTLPAKGTLYNTPYGKLDSNFYAGDANWDTYKRKQKFVGYEFDHRFNDSWGFTQKARYMDISAYTENTYNMGLDSDDRTLARRAYMTDEKLKGFTIDNQINGNIKQGIFDHYLLLGFDYQWQDSDVIYQDAEIPALDLFAPNHHLVDRDHLEYSPYYATDIKIKAHQTGYYLQDQIKIKDLVLVAGGRYDVYRRDTVGLQYGSEVNDIIDQDNFSKRFGALYTFDNGISPYISYSEGFEPVAGKSATGSQFKASTSKQWEAGVKYLSANKATTLTASVFDLTKKDALTADPNDPYKYVQTGEIESKGYELELITAPIANWQTTLSYAYTDVEVTKDNTGLKGKTPVWVAKHKASLWTSYIFDETVLSGLTLGAGIRYMGTMQMDANNSDKIPAVTLFDMAASYDLGVAIPALENTSIKISVNNLTDKRYVASCYDSNNCWFGAERTIDVGVKYQF